MDIDKTTKTYVSFSTTSFYEPDSAFKENLKYRCMLLVDEGDNESKSRFSKFFGWWNNADFRYKLASVTTTIFLIGGSSFIINFNNGQLSTDFVLTQVYAENPQTNLMPFMMVSSNFNSFTDQGNAVLNPSYVPLAREIKNYNYGHVGYQVKKGDTSVNCDSLYPFPPELTRVEAFEYVTKEGDVYYKMYNMGKSGAVDNYMLFKNGELVKVNSDGTQNKAVMNIININYEVNDILGNLPENVEIRNEGDDFIVLSWKKEIMCNNDQIEDMLISISVNKENYKIKNLTTYINNNSPKNMFYSIDFVTKTSSDYEFDNVKSKFEVNQVQSVMSV